MQNEQNVLGQPLQSCSLEPLTGFWRDGCCRTGPEDVGKHTVCIEITESFLTFSLARGNDLITPRPEYGFAGLKTGDRWCLCALRWIEALKAGVAPRVWLASTNEDILELVSLETLVEHAADLPGLSA